MPANIIFGDLGEKDPEELRSALHAAGITRIDTAAAYRNGESERRIGAAKLTEDFTVDTKILFRIPPDGTLSPEAIEKSLSNSLQALGVKKVNVLYCHAPDYATPVADSAKAFDEQYKKGRFSKLGVSNFKPEMLQEWLEIAEKEGYVKPTVFQGHYNLLVRHYESTLFPLLRNNGIAFNAYSPLAGGFLLGNYTQEGVQAGSRFASPGIYPKLYDNPALHSAIRKLRAVSQKTGLGMDELSLRWEKYHSALGDEDAMIIGASKIAQIEINTAQLAKGPLDEGVVGELNALYESDEGVKEAAGRIVDYETLVTAFQELAAASKPSS